MTSVQKLLRDIKTLRESIQLDWKELDSPSLSAEENRDIREHISWCVKELADLHARLEKLEIEPNPDLG